LSASASESDSGDFFGESVAIDGDTAVVGAPRDDRTDIGADPSQGSVYTFAVAGRDRPASELLIETAKLTASDGAPLDLLGTSVAIESDQVIAGASSDEVGPNTNQGSASVFFEPAPDGDGDGVPDVTDNCPSEPNSAQIDTDSDDQGDACDLDDDGDGVDDGSDAFPLDPGESADTDSDGVGDNVDNCRTIPNPGQADSDLDGIGDACDNRPPDCSVVEPSTDELFPPNHKLRAVTLSGASDPDGDLVTLAITAVTQDEPVNSRGDGNTAYDAEDGESPDEVLVRAERSGSGDGRVYRIALEVTDSNGGSCTGTVRADVPRSRATPAVDSSVPSYDSFTGAQVGRQGGPT
jgi:hypothetical protein